jgi:hypothetical protein
MMSLRGQLICVWTLPVAGIVWIAAALLFPGFLPPMSPTLSADAVAAFYRDPDHLARTRAAMIFFNWFSVGLIPFSAVIVTQMKRMELYSPVLAYAFLICVTTSATLFATTDLYFQVLAYRPDRDPQIQQMINDFAWLNFTAPMGFIIGQNLALALAIYLDRSPRPIFRPWVGHLNVLVAAIVAPAALSAMNLTGPLAWNGFWSYWMRLSALVVYIVVMFFVVLGAVLRQKREEASPGQPHDARAVRAAP